MPAASKIPALQLALFTPGAYVWPVHRNFESFIAALGTPALDAPDIAVSRLYPARTRTDSATTGLPEALDARLLELHRELYSALLRPLSYFEREPRRFADRFLPDLRPTGAGALFEALVFYFGGRTFDNLSIPQGLNIVRTVFFNHEAAEPALWLETARKRLVAERAPLSALSGTLPAPPMTRLHDLAFCIHTAPSRPPSSTGWITGQVRRSFDGRAWVDYTCGRDPSLEAAERLAKARPQLEAEVSAALQTVFGWRQEAKAA
jgi:hypothetical protein